MHEGSTPEPRSGHAVPGTLTMREVDELDFVDTLPWVGVPSPK